MSIETPSLLTVGMFIEWAKAVTVWFMMFWAFLPLALAARELAL